MKKYSLQALAAIVFMFFSGSIIADTYPDLAIWSATQTALDSKEGKEALKDLFKGITDCKENRLWKLTPTG